MLKFALSNNGEKMKHIYKRTFFKRLKKLLNILIFASILVLIFLKI